MRFPLGVGLSGSDPPVSELSSVPELSVVSPLSVVPELSVVSPLSVVPELSSTEGSSMTLVSSVAPVSALLGSILSKTILNFRFFVP